MNQQALIPNQGQTTPMCRKEATTISDQVYDLSDWNPGVSLQLRQGLIFQSENVSENLYYLQKQHMLF